MNSYNLKQFSLISCLLVYLFLSIENAAAFNQDFFCTSDSDCTIESQCTFGICNKNTGKCSTKIEDEYNWCEPIGICNSGLCELTENINDLSDTQATTAVSTGSTNESVTSDEDYKIWEI